MKFLMTTAVLLLTLATTTADAADTATTAAVEPKAKRAKPAAMSAETRRDLERRIEALERTYEMQYRETDSPAGVPGAGSAPPTKPAAH